MLEGSAHDDLKQHAEAQKSFRQALALNRKIGSRSGEANALMRLANAQSAAGQYASAIENYQLSLRILRATQQRWHETLALCGLARAQVQRKQYTNAAQTARLALAAAQEVGSPDLQWQAWESLADAAEARGNAEQAIFLRKQAVNAIQSLRAGAVNLDKELQRSMLGNKERVYRELADGMIASGRLAEAEQVMAMLKEEEYFDFIRRDAAADARQTTLGASDAEAPWAERYQQISGKLAELGREYEALRAVPQASRTPEQQARFEALKADLEVSKQAFQSYLAELDQAFAAEGTERAMDYAEQGLASVRALQGSLARLGQGAVIVHYLILPQKLHILVTTPTVQIHRERPIAQAELNKLVFQYRDILQGPSRDPMPAAKALYDVLIAPIAADLQQANARVLMLSLDGVLRYLPFAALHDGSQYLVARYGFALFTPAGRASLERKPQPEWTIAGLGVSKGAAPGADKIAWAPLPAVPVELDEIVQQGASDGAGILSGSVGLDEAFTAGTFSEALEAGPQVVHIASHFNFTAGTDADSYLLLGGGTKLTLADFKTGNFPLASVDLLTLSACQTALGDTQRRNGREVEGFGALAQNQGAASVMATLWSVADGSTGLFMREFYRRRQSEHLTKADALRVVQLGFIGGELRPDTAPVALRGAIREVPQAQAVPKAARYTPPANAPFAHPFFWAPFILMGNWL